MGKEKLSTEHHGAYAGIRSGSSEYNDGGNINYQGGNDDYRDENLLKDAFSSGPEPSEIEIGIIAYGNKLESAE